MYGLIIKKKTVKRLSTIQRTIDSKNNKLKEQETIYFSIHIRRLVTTDSYKIPFIRI